MAKGNEAPTPPKSKRSVGSSVDRTRKGVLATSAGAIPLAISILVGSTGGNAVKPHRPASHATQLSASEIQFSPGCRMPFQSNPIPAIDSECGIEGTGSTEDKIAERKAKNDFCVPTSKVTPIT